MKVKECMCNNVCYCTPDTKIADVAKMMNNNKKVEEFDLSQDNLNSIINKILLISRIHKINTSETSIDKVWFMVQVEKIVRKEKAKENATH